MKSNLLLAGAIVASMIGGAANAFIIDFNSHPVDYANPITDSGFTFNVSASGWGVFKNSDGACCNINDNGSRALFADGDNSGPANIVMTETGGEAFGVSSLDASVYFTGANPDTLILTGDLAGGGTVTTTLNTTTTWTHFNLSGFQDLTSLTFTDGTSGAFLSAPGMGIDNIDIGGGVPEPATWGLMLAGFGLVGATMRRCRTAVAA